MFMGGATKLVFIIAVLSTVSAPANAFGVVGPPIKITISSGNHQTTGVVGTMLQAPYVVLVTDQGGNPVPNTQVDWKAAFGGGSLSSSSSFTNSAGLASVTLTLGTVYESNTTTAKIHNTTKSINFWTVAYPGAVTAITSKAGDKQSATIATALPAPLQAICKDKYGNTARHTQVDWSVVSGGGSLATTSSITSMGFTSNTLTLGTAAGVARIAAAVHGTTLSYLFTATAVAGAPAQIAVSSGNNQAGSQSSPLARPFVVSVKDVYGNLKSGAMIDWTVSASGASFSPGSTMSSAQGLANSTLILGPSTGQYSATATIHGTGISQAFTATSVNAMIAMQKNPAPNPHAFQPYFLGLSYEKNKINVPFFSTQNLPLVALFNRLGPGVLRIVAELQPLPISWVHNGPGLTKQQVSQADIQRLAAFVKAVHWKILYGIALADNVAVCAPGSTSCAADEAAVVANAFGSSLLGFEIGNEPDQYIKAVYGNPPVAQLPGYTFDQYISTTPIYVNGSLLPSWPAFADAIKAAVPSAALTGPSAGIVWDRLFAASNQSSRVALLTRHYYRSSYLLPPDMPTLLSPDPRVPKQFPEMALDAAAGNIPGGYRISECNSVSGFISGVTNGFGAALWTIDFLFSNALYQSTGVNFHGGGDVPETFSPILDDHNTVVGIGPDYYGMLAYSLIAKGGTLMPAVMTSAPATFSAYAVQQPDGTTDAILSNKDPVNVLTVGLSRPSTMTQATSLLLTAPSLTSSDGFTLGGSPVALDGSWAVTETSSWPITGNAAIITIPAGSAQVVHMR